MNCACWPPRSTRDVSRYAELQANRAAIAARRNSPRVNNPAVKAAIAKIDGKLGERKSLYAQRAAKQSARLKLPKFPTTTIGSFPQTAEIRQARSQFKAGEINEAAYKAAMQTEIARACASRKNWDSTCWCTARPSATTWSNTSASSLRVTPSPVRLGAELRLALREAADHLRRHQPPEADDGRVEQVRPIPHRQTDEGHADRSGHDAAMVLRARRPAAPVTCCKSRWRSATKCWTWKKPACA